MVVQPPSQRAEVRFQLGLGHAREHVPPLLARGVVQVSHELVVVFPGAHQNRGKGPLAGLNAFHHLRRPHPPTQQHKACMGSQPHPQGLVMVDVGLGDIVQQQGKKQDHPAHGARTHHLADFQPTVAPTHVGVHAHEGVHRPPKQWHDKKGNPQVLVRTDVDLDAKSPGFNHRLSEDKEGHPSRGSRHAIGPQVPHPPTVPRLAVAGFGGFHFNRQSARI